MIARSLATTLALFLCLASGHIALGQEVPLEKPKPADLTNVQRRLVELEKHLEVLMREIEVLRVQAKPASDQLRATVPDSARGKSPPPLPAAAARAEVRIFLLRNASAPEIARVLRELYPKDDRIRIAVHQSTNSVIVRAAALEMEVIEAIITRLDGIVTDTKKATPRPEDDDTKKAKPRPEDDARAPQRGDDLLKAQRERVQVEEQRLTDQVQAVISRARSLHAEVPAAALKLLRDAQLHVWDHPDISARVADELLGRIVNARRTLGTKDSDLEKSK